MVTAIRCLTSGRKRRGNPRTSAGPLSALLNKEMKKFTLAANIIGLISGILTIIIFLTDVVPPKGQDLTIKNKEQEIEEINVINKIDSDVAEILEIDVNPILQKWHQYLLTIVFFIFSLLFFRYVAPKVFFKK